MDVRVVAAQMFIQWNACGFSSNVVACDIYAGLYGTVSGVEPVHDAVDRADRAGIHSQKRVSQIFSDCQNGARVVARYKRERSCLTVACDPLVGEDLHNTGVHVRDCCESDLHRLLKSKIRDQKLYVCDDHAALPFIWAQRFALWALNKK